MATPLTRDEFRKMERASVGKVAHLYGLNPRVLSLKCLKKEVPGAVQLKKRWYVTPECMDRLFTKSKG